MNKFSTATMAKIGLLSAISFMLMFLEFQAPIFPAFLKFDLSELPVLIGAMALGPAAGVAIELIKNLLDLTKTTSGGIGQAANFIMGCALILPVSIAYKKSRTRGGYILGAAAGVVLMVVVASLANYFVLIPMYSKFMPIEAIIQMAQAVNASIVDMKTLVLFGVAPFNVVKGVGITVIGYAMFPALRPVLTPRAA